MTEIINKVTTGIDHRIEAAFINSTERVYNEKIRLCGGFGHTTRDQRRLMWGEACDTVANKPLWKVIRAIW